MPARWGAGAQATTWFAIPTAAARRLWRRRRRRPSAQQPGEHREQLAPLARRAGAHERAHLARPGRAAAARGAARRRRQRRRSWRGRAASGARDESSTHARSSACPFSTPRAWPPKSVPRAGRSRRGRRPCWAPGGEDAAVGAVRDERVLRELAARHVQPAERLREQHDLPDRRIELSPLHVGAGRAAEAQRPVDGAELVRGACDGRPELLVRPSMRNAL